MFYFNKADRNLRKKHRERYPRQPNEGRYVSQTTTGQACEARIVAMAHTYQPRQPTPTPPPEPIQPYPSTYIYLDIEGSHQFPVEVAALATRFGGILGVFHQFSYQTDPQFRQASVHCHGLLRSELWRDGTTRRNLFHQFREWIMEWSDAMIWGNGVLDLNKFLALSRISAQAQDVGLPDWEHRAQLPCHITTLEAKRNGSKIGDKTCGPQHGRHSQELRPKKTNTPGQRAKADWGFHCALFDVLEIFLFHQEDPQWP